MMIVSSCCKIQQAETDNMLVYSDIGADEDGQKTVKNKF